ncbi:hypothetical protein Bca52824_008993 [Brassica carinata]|uniref:Uncharacterized protein n=1 Tax=Brassica carinata TaxID=52824 RepID=A0A8X7WCC1_BRACI|nr:hypothetical protein Bca52824_008992 [Brassica carinata]KAG2326265.1 hypothetical protein Bca52824_008993 [Brassica carinata]
MVEFNKEEYFGGLDEYWRRVNESQGLDIEGIVGPKGMVASGQLLSYQCEGLGGRSYPFSQKVKCYGRLGLRRYNLIQGTNFELQHLIKFNMRYSGACSFYITLEAVDTLTRGPAQTFQVCADGVFGLSECGLFPRTYESETTSGGETSVLAVHGGGGGSTKKALPNWPSDAEINAFTRSELEKFSSLELLKVAIETDDETPLQAKSSVLYIAFRGLATIDGTDESVEQKSCDQKPVQRAYRIFGSQGILLKDRNSYEFGRLLQAFIIIGRRLLAMSVEEVLQVCVS